MSAIRCSGSPELIFSCQSKKKLPATNEILGGDMGVKEVVVDLETYNIIVISNMDKVSFTPTK